VTTDMTSIWPKACLMQVHDGGVPVLCVGHDGHVRREVQGEQPRPRLFGGIRVLLFRLQWQIHSLSCSDPKGR